MQINIHPRKLIGHIQSEFAALFPYLRLEFLLEGSGPGSAHTPITAPPEMLLGSLQTKIMQGTISIRPGMTVKELEEVFRKEFFLDMQLFRRSGRAWLETTATDSWTLYQQDEHGYESTLHLNRKEEANLADHDLTRDTF